MTLKETISKMVGVHHEPSVRMNEEGETKGQVLREAGQEFYDGSAKTLEALKLAMGDAYDAGSVKAEELAAKSKEELGKGYVYTKEKATEGAKILGHEIYDKAGVLKEHAQDFGAKSGNYLKEKGDEAWESTEAYSKWLAEKTAEEASHQFQNAKEFASDAADFTQQQFKEGVDQLPHLTNAAYELAGNTFERTKNAAGDTIERITDASGDFYERVIHSAHDENNVFNRYKDATDEQGRKLMHQAGKLYDEKTQQAEEEAHGLFHSMHDGLSHLGHSIGSVFHAKKEDAEKLGQEMNEKSSKLAQSGRYYAEEAAANTQAGYDHLKNKVNPPSSSNWFTSIFGGHQKQQNFNPEALSNYFKKNKHLNPDEWKAYFKHSNINPQNWMDYMDAYQKGPRGLNAFWQKLERQGESAKNSLQNQYYSTKNNAYQSINNNAHRFNSRGALRMNDDDTSTTTVAPVSLFWTAVLALYLLVLAKRVFEQKRQLVSHEKDGRDTPASSAAEKLRLSDVARASSDSLSNFALYAPATAVVLLTHELQNAANTYVLHGLYAALFVGQILQNEATYVSTPKARGAGIYLSWAAAGLAGAAGITTSLTGFRF